MFPVPLLAKPPEHVLFDHAIPHDRKRLGGDTGHGPATDQKAIFVSANDNLLTIVNIPGED
jgi:hypothetical protein